MQTAESFELRSAAAQAAELRDRLRSEHLSGGLLYLEAGQHVPRNGSDVYYFPYRAESNFVYVTGCSTLPGAACLLDMDSGELTLMAPKQPPEAAYWMGPQPTLDELAKEYGASSACYTEDLEQLLGSYKHRGKSVHTMACLADKVEEAIGLEGAPRVVRGIVTSTLHRCRAYKTRSEVACLLHANAASGAAHAAMWEAAAPGVTEYQLEAAFRSEAMRRGCGDLGYPCIVGSGPNAAVLHYESNRRVTQAGDLVLVDAGAEFRCYTADISRTFPVGGKFSANQRDLYLAVLAAQEHAIAHMTAGATLHEVDSGARRVMLGMLADMGLVQGSVDELLDAKVDRVFMPHGLSHHLGLDVHDVSSTGPVAKTFEAGHVVTVEPGCYFIDPLLDKAAADPKQSKLLRMDAVNACRGTGGVRIEDNVYIQDDGCFNITAAAGVPKAPHAVEAIMAAARA